MQIKNAHELSQDALLYEIKDGAKVVYFQYSISIIVMTFKRPSGFYLIRNGESTFQYHWPFTILSFLFGWWGFPWGFIYTPMVLFTNFNGGNDITSDLVHELTGKEVESRIIEETYEVTSFDKRILAFFIDFFISMIFTIALFTTIFKLFGFSENIKMVGVLFTFVYYILISFLESSKYRASIGKMICGLQVTTIDGNQLTFSEAISRNTIKFLSSLLFFAGHFFAFFNDKKQALHDKTVNSIVIKAVKNTEKMYM